ncbi:GNAT family N-acetyltransferase [Clostridium sp. Mt-5]|uniref:GNAT family N-acetyltransferase n=1 Tax=Clostridium moutaii TaxID=3240932 RepID=A0ABV4BJC0_9CLOT
MIRKGKLSDLDTIVEYNYNLAKETENLGLDKNILKKGVEKALLDDKNGAYFVYEKDGMVVGQMMLTKEWSDWRNANYWWIQSVYVNKNYRGQGIYKKLFKHVKSVADSDNNVYSLRLYVEKNNEKAKNTYKSLGMDETYYLVYEIKK